MGKIIWVGRSRSQAKRIEKRELAKGNPAIMSSGPIILKGKEVSGYAVGIYGRQKKLIKKPIRYVKRTNRESPMSASYFGYGRGNNLFGI